MSILSFPTNLVLRISNSKKNYVPLRLGNVAEKFVEKINTRILCLVTFLRKSCRVLGR
jgi:hypothetical protein